MIGENDRSPVRGISGVRDNFFNRVKNVVTKVLKDYILKFFLVVAKFATTATDGRGFVNEY